MWSIAIYLALPPQATTGSLAEIGQQADLAIVVGGDGNLLGTARILARYDIKVIGINRGNLGFLTDLNPDDALAQLSDVLTSNFRSDKRFLLEAQVCRSDNLNRCVRTPSMKLCYILAKLRI